MPKNKNKKARLVVDANAWISSLLTPRFRFRLEIVFGAAYSLMFSEELLDDLKRAMRKPYLARNINPAIYKQLVERLRAGAELIDVHSVVNV